MAQELQFDFDQITTRMLIDFKEKTGTSLMSLIDDAGEIDMANMSEEMIAGCIWLALRMSDNPDATWDDALDMPFTALQFVGEEDETDPTNASNGS